MEDNNDAEETRNCTHKSINKEECKRLDGENKNNEEDTETSHDKIEIDEEVVEENFIEMILNSVEDGEILFTSWKSGWKN